jgi:hypothetical protein
LPETPVLQRPPVDEYVKVTASFAVSETPKPPQTEHQNGPATYIQYGSIIYYWANGITEVFGPDGKRILIAKDSEATHEPVPAGVIAPVTHIISMPNDGSGTRSEEGSLTIEKHYLDSVLILTIIDSKDNYQQH